MYSHEILELLKLKRNLISHNEYIQIIKSPQINHIKYDNNVFNIWTNDGYKFEFKLLNKEK